jgi:hypothetical protein
MRGILVRPEGHSLVPEWGVLSPGVVPGLRFLGRPALYHHHVSNGHQGRVIGRVFASARFLAPGGRVWCSRSRTGERSVRWAAVQQPAQCSRRVAEVLSYGAAQMRLIGEPEVGG